MVMLDMVCSSEGWLLTALAESGPVVQVPDTLGWARMDLLQAAANQFMDRIG
jgi:hypothetical protein